MDDSEKQNIDLGAFTEASAPAADAAPGVSVGGAPAAAPQPQPAPRTDAPKVSDIRPAAPGAVPTQAAIAETPARPAAPATFVSAAPPHNKKMIVRGVAATAVVIIVVAAGIFSWPSIQKMFGGTPAAAPSSTASSAAPAAPAATPLTDVTFSPTVYQVALASATQWQADAALIKMSLTDTSGNSWDLIFMSPKLKNKGYEILVSGGAITSAQEVSIEGAGATMPANIISPDDAMAQAIALPGEANRVIVGLQLSYGADHVWYWVMQFQGGGGLSIKATP